MILDVSKISNSTLLGKVIRFPLRLIPDSAVVSILQGPNRGFRWINGSGPAGFWIGCYEKQKQVRLSGCIHRRDVVFDVGANAGFYTLLSSRFVGPEGKVIAFEPLPSNLDILRRHLAMNSIANVELLPMALAEQKGTAKFNTSSGPSEGSISDSGDIVVQTDCIDSLVESGTIPSPSVIKMDIEGGEVNAIKGAQRTLRRVRPKLFLAVHNQLHQQCIDLLKPIYDHIEWLETDELIATSTSVSQ